METLARLTEQKNAIYAEADKLQKEMNLLLAGKATNAMTKIRWKHQLTAETIEEQHFDKTWEQVYRRVRELRSRSHTIIHVGTEGDRRSSWDVHQLISELFDKAADIEAKIQAVHREAMRERKAA